MGPRSFNRGNGREYPVIEHLRPGFNGAAVFQPRKSERAVGAARGVSNAASMGPRSFNRGNVEEECPMRERPIASMGPRSFNRGNEVFASLCGPRWRELQWGRGLSTAEMPARQLVRHRVVAASMGPRSFNRGNLPCPSPTWSSTTSFNGAAVFQPRKFGRRPVLRVFPQCFNGAAVFQPRKSAELLGTEHRKIGASMGPRSFNRGNQQHPGSAYDEHSRFNGAAVFQPRK